MFQRYYAYRNLPLGISTAPPALRNFVSAEHFSPSFSAANPYAIAKPWVRTIQRLGKRDQNCTVKCRVSAEGKYGDELS